MLAWLPFILSHSFQTIYSHFDGPLYIIPAKTGYDPRLIAALLRDPAMPHSPLYYAAHLPLYPLLIWLGAHLPYVGFLKSMLMTTVVTSICMAWFMYYMLKKLSLSRQPLLLTIIFLLIPRLWVVRSVGSPEPLFILLILLSLFAFEKKNYVLAGMWGGLATLTKIPGILLFPAYLLAIGESVITQGKLNREEVGQMGKQILSLLLIPFALSLLFAFYYARFNDFYAYFHTGGAVPMPYPFSVFNASAKWVGTGWLEDVLFFFALFAASVVALWRSRARSFFYFTFTFLFALIFVQHRDISRYGLPLIPLACIAFEKQITSRQSLMVALFLVAALYLYVVTFLAYNTMPITEWLPFL